MYNLLIAQIIESFGAIFTLLNPNYFQIHTRQVKYFDFRNFRLHKGSFTVIYSVTYILRSVF